MRASRAYIAGLGTTGVLVASALLLLGVVSALVAFQGWPGSGFAENTSSLRVGQSERIEVDGPVQVASNAGPTAAAVAGSPAPGSAAAGSQGTATLPLADPPSVRVVTPTGGGGEFRDLGPPLPVREDPQVPPVDQTPEGLLPETPLSPQVNQLAGSLGNTTQSVTDGLGFTVGQLSPQLGGTVTDTGRVLAELLRSLGRTSR